MPRPATEPDPELLSADARRLIDMHGGDWDSLHAFEALHWDGARFRVSIHAAIDTGFADSAYPGLMQEMSLKVIQASPENPPYAYALQIEGHMSELAPGATAEEKAQMEADLKAERLHLRPGAREFAQAWVADIHGRLWAARTFRDTPGTVTEWAIPAGTRLRTPFAAGLVACARMTGLCEWGLDPTPEEDRLLQAIRQAAGK